MVGGTEKPKFDKGDMPTAKVEMSVVLMLASPCKVQVRVKFLNSFEVSALLSH